MQKTDNHIVFMGIPLDGNYQVFGRKILQKGFKHGYKSYETGELKTFYNYAEYRDCYYGKWKGIPVNISIGYTPLSKIVRLVSISTYEFSYKWEEIKQLYEKIKKEYISVYGQPSPKLTNENEPYTLTLYESGIDFDYSCGFYVKNGRIFILIDNFKKGLYISILYVDDINQTIYDNELNK